MKLPTIRRSITQKTLPTEPCPSPQDLKQNSKRHQQHRGQKRRFPAGVRLRRSGILAALLGPEDVHLDGLRPLAQAAVLRGRAVGALRPHLREVAALDFAGQVLPHLPSAALQDGSDAAEDNIYVLGCYRAGDRCPYMLDAIPLRRVRASVLEGLGWVGGIAAVQE